MDTSKIGEKFTILGQDPRNFLHSIRWMNDSNCLVIFKTPQNTQIALDNLLQDPKKFRIKVEEDGTVELPTEWFDLKGYNRFGIERKLSARLATEAELSFKKVEALINQYAVFEVAEKELPTYLLTKFKNHDQYDKMIVTIAHSRKAKWAFKPLNRSTIIRSYDDTREFSNYIQKRDRKGSNVYEKFNGNTRRMPLQNPDMGRISGGDYAAQKNIDSNKMAVEEVSVFDNGTI